MTTDERLARIERVTAGIAEERRKDREESRQLWRDTQRQIQELTLKLDALTVKVADVTDHLGARIESLAEESRAADARLGDRIESLVSAIGQFIASQQHPRQ